MKKTMLVSAIAAALMLCLVQTSALAQGEWSDAYLSRLKQGAASAKHVAILAPLSAEGPALVDIAVGASGSAKVSVYGVSGNGTQRYSAEDSAFSFDAFSFPAFKSASIQQRIGSSGALCAVLTVNGGGRATRIAFTPAGAGKLDIPYFASMTTQNGRTRYMVAGSSATKAQFDAAQSAFNAKWKKKGGNLPTTTLARGASASTVTSRFHTLRSKYEKFSTATGVRLNRTTLSLVAGKTAPLVAQVKPASAVADAVSFESSDPAVASVNGQGMVSGISAGRATITARTASGRKHACAVTVTGVSGAVTGVSLDATSLSLIKGESRTLVATPLPVGRESDLAWKSSDPSVASVSDGGKVLGISRGKAVITVSTPNGKTATCKVVVNNTAAMIVDISSHNASSKMDWALIAKNVDLLILRCGVTRTKTAPLGVGRDTSFPYYAQQCKKYGIPFGVYYYGKCATVAQAKKEAELTWKVASPYNPLFYVYDAEEACLNKEKIETYIKTLKGLGAKKTGYYIAHHRYTSYKLDTSLVDFIWLPHYGDNNGKVNSTPSYACDIHQYSSNGRVPGFPGVVDVNRLMGGKTLDWFTSR